LQGRLPLPLTGTAAGEAALATSLIIARNWNAHVTALHVRVDSRDAAPLAGDELSGARPYRRLCNVFGQRQSH